MDGNLIQKKQVYSLVCARCDNSYFSEYIREKIEQKRFRFRSARQFFKFFLKTNKYFLNNYLKEVIIFFVSISVLASTTLTNKSSFLNLRLLIVISEAEIATSL